MLWHNTQLFLYMQPYLSGIVWPRSRREGRLLRHYWRPSGKSHNASLALRKWEWETDRASHLKETTLCRCNKSFSYGAIKTLMVYSRWPVDSRIAIKVIQLEKFKLPTSSSRNWFLLPSLPSSLKGVMTVDLWADCHAALIFRQAAALDVMSCMFPLCRVKPWHQLNKHACVAPQTPRHMN